MKNNVISVYIYSYIYIVTYINNTVNKHWGSVVLYVSGFQSQFLGYSFNVSHEREFVNGRSNKQSIKY